MSEQNGMIFGIRKGSRQDGPGLRTTILFKGCPMSCWWCASPESQSPATELMFMKSRCIRCGTCVTVCSLEAAREEFVIAEGAGENAAGYTIEREVCIVCGSCIEKCPGNARELVGKRASVSEVMAEIKATLPALDQTGGVTFSGGEPLMQAGFLGALLAECKSLGLHTMVDTSGYGPWETLDRVRGNVDLFLFQLKLMDDNLHRQFTGVSNEGILFNLKTLAEEGHAIRLRIPVIPGITDRVENLQAIAAFILTLPALDGIELLPYQQTAREKYEPLGLSSPMDDPCAVAKDQLADVVRLFESYHLPVRVVC